MAEDVVGRVRAREYPDPGPGIFFNAASWGLIPRSAAEEASDLTLRRNRGRGFAEEELGRIQRRCREALARLLRVTADEIALSPNTSFGLNLAAALVASGPPGRVVVPHGEFPANVLPWKALASKGFQLELVPTDAEGRPDAAALTEALGQPDVRALALSAVQFSTGYRADLVHFGALCRPRGILFCVDGIQALGAVPLHPVEANIDVLASGGQKWLCSPWGSGFTYVRRDLVEKLTPPMVSWLGVEGGARFDDMLHYRMDFLSSARRFELATLGLQDYLALARSVEIFLEVGVDRVAAHIRRVHQPFLTWAQEREDVILVTPEDPGHRAGILSFIPEDPARVAGHLESAGVTFALREGVVRLAPHFYNTVEEMEEVVGLLREVA